jgi:hypothetical protein
MQQSEAGKVKQLEKIDLTNLWANPLAAQQVCSHSQRNERG